MKYSTKQKNIYNLRYNTLLTSFNIFLVSLIALWISIFIQSQISIQYKLFISATIINIIILVSIYLLTKQKRVEEEILSLK